MENKKLETYLGFCIRSGKIIFGTEMISRKKKGVKLLIVDGGIGASSLKIMLTAKETLRCPLLQTENGELGALLHKPAVKAIAITEEHLSSAILALVGENTNIKFYSGGNN